MAWTVSNTLGSSSTTRILRSGVSMRAPGRRPDGSGYLDAAFLLDGALDGQVRSHCCQTSVSVEFCREQLQQSWCSMSPFLRGWKLTVHDQMGQDCVANALAVAVRMWRPGERRNHSQRFSLHIASFRLPCGHEHGSDKPRRRALQSAGDCDHD